MCRQVIEHDAHLVGLWIMGVGEFAHTLGEVASRAVLGDLDPAPAAMDIEEHEQIGRAVALIFAVIAFELPRLGWDRLAHLTDELGWALVKADHGPLWIGCFGVEIEHVLHVGNVGAVDCATHHMSLRHGLRWFSARRRRTVSRDRSSCSVSLTIAPANNSRVQRARPSGGFEQAVATSSASSLPVSLRAAPGRGSSLSAASRLPSTKRRLVRYIVDSPMARLVAIASSLTPESAARRICARFSLRAACLPPLSNAVSCSRSFWSSSTR